MAQFSLFAQGFPMGGAPHALPRRDGCSKKKAATNRVPKVRQRRAPRGTPNRLGTNIWRVFNTIATMLVEHRSQPKTAKVVGPHNRTAR